MANKDLKYIAIKVKGLNHWLWFEQEKVIEMNGTFEGTDGWGAGGNLTSIKISNCEITGRIYSQALQY